MIKSELISIIVKCGGCKKKVTVVNASFEVDDPGRCGGCESNNEEFYTCMCEAGRKTIELCCPKCNTYSEIEVH